MKLHRVGALWKPKPGGESRGTGSMTINGMRQRFVILDNRRKQKDTDPDYVLMSSDEPEVDRYEQAREQQSERGSAAGAYPSERRQDGPARRYESHGDDPVPPPDDDIPF